MNVHLTNPQAVQMESHEKDHMIAVAVLEWSEHAKMLHFKGRQDDVMRSGFVSNVLTAYHKSGLIQERLLYPLKRIGAKGEGNFTRISWDEAMQHVAESLLRTEFLYGHESIWPYAHPQALGYIQHASFDCLRHIKRYARQHNNAQRSLLSLIGGKAGSGALSSVPIAETALADVIILWGYKPTKEVMSYIETARASRGAKLVIIDADPTDALVERADMSLRLKQGTDAALACALMHILFQKDMADRSYLARFSDKPEALEEHLHNKTPHWAAKITGLSVETITALAVLMGENQRTFWHMGPELARASNPVMAYHAALCVPVIAGHWQYEGGGVSHTIEALSLLDRSALTGTAFCDPNSRILNSEQGAEILTGMAEALNGGAALKALLIQNRDMIKDASDKKAMRAGLAREDLFLCVHSVAMNETVKMADIVLPATTMFEHDDLYASTNTQLVLAGLRQNDQPMMGGEARSYHDMVCELAKRLGITNSCFTQSARQHIDTVLQNGFNIELSQLEKAGVVRQALSKPDFEETHFLNGFKQIEGKFCFKLDWQQLNERYNHALGDWRLMPKWPDYTSST